MFSAGLTLSRGCVLIMMGKTHDEQQGKNALTAGRLPQSPCCTRAAENKEVKLQPQLV